MRATLHLLEATDFPDVKRGHLETLQVNLGYRCNQSCVHCHVNAGPNRKEMMDQATLELILQVIKARRIRTLDLTGGAPELHDGFRVLVKAARAEGMHVIDRCNLTILFEAGQEDLADFLASHDVEVVASLPCHSFESVDEQRGKGVFDKSIKALQILNDLGYGREGTNLKLNLVYNPLVAELPPSQQQLEAIYKHELGEKFGIAFNQLYALTNMPIKRFGSTLVSKGKFNAYMSLLKDNYQEANRDHLMCRSLVSVDWQGHLYDCDFNQQLGLKLAGKHKPHVRDLLEEDVNGLLINVADHCYGCTAAQGSSCGGAL